jgi:hypothetical protein
LLQSAMKRLEFAELDFKGQVGTKQLSEL